MSLDNHILVDFEDCWGVLAELEDLAKLVDSLGESFAAAKLEKVVRDYDTSFDLLLNKLEQHFIDLDTDFVPNQEEEGDYAAEKDNNAGW